jgi:hypothetical protein
VLGDKHKLKKLRAEGHKAPAEVIASHAGPAITVTQPGTLGTSNWKITLMVHPDHEPPFEATVHRRVPAYSQVPVGSQTFVYYDPDDHSEVMEALDEEGALGMGAADIQAMTGGQSSSGDMMGLLEQVERNPKGFDKAALVEALGYDATGVTQDTRTIISGVPQPVAGVAGAAAPAAAPDDTLAKLTQLADLRDRGVLSSEEFEAQKARILGESS